MKQKIKILILPLILFLIFFGSQTVKADPPDESGLSFLLPDCQSQSCEIGKIINAQYVISWPEALYLINAKTGDKISDASKIKDYQSLFIDYIKQNSSLSSKNEICEFFLDKFPELDPETVLFDGIQYDGHFTCQENISNMIFKDSLFMDYIDTQTNFVWILDSDNKLLKQIYFKKGKESAVLEFSNLLKSTIDSNKADIDKETDSPIKPVKKPALISFDKNLKTASSLTMIAKEDVSSTSSSLATIDKKDNNLTLKQTENNMPRASTSAENMYSSISDKQGSNNSLNQRSRFSSFLLNVLKGGKQTTWPLTLLLVFLLGMLHSLESGHSKTILAALLINKNISLRRSFGYAAVFTITHVADILLLGILFISANLFFNLYSLLPHLQIFALYALLFIATYLLIKSSTHYIQHKLGYEHEHHHHHHHHHDHEHEHGSASASDDFKHQLYIGFIVGLAPCLFGWSIFMLFLSTGLTWFIIPLILAFAFGIFLSLVLISMAIVKLKDHFMDRIGWLGDISPIISALLLLIFALWQII